MAKGKTYDVVHTTPAGMHTSIQTPQGRLAKTQCSLSPSDAPSTTTPRPRKQNKCQVVRMGLTHRALRQHTEIESSSSHVLWAVQLYAAAYSPFEGVDMQYSLISHC